MSILAIFNSLASSVFADWQSNQNIANAGVNPMVDSRPQLPQAESFPQTNLPLPQEGFTPSPQQPYQGGFQGTPQMPESESFPQSNIPEFEETLRQPTVMDTGGESVFHETSGEQVKNLVTPIVDKTGLNVSLTPELALGQSGKGALIEFDKDILLGDRGSLRGIRKPGSAFVGQEFELVGGSGNPRAVKSFTLKEGIKFHKDPRYNKRIIRRILLDFNEEKQEDGSTKFIRKPTPSKGGK